MNLIALETATAIPTVCLVSGEHGVRCWRGSPRPGADALLAGVRQLLDGAGLDFGDLDAVACGRGPGAFTGVRLGIALTQGLSLGIGCPVVTVSELVALAWRAHLTHGWERVLACLDARRGEVYWAAYACGGEQPQALSEEAIAVPGDVALPSGEWTLAGSGAALLNVAPDIAMDVSLAPDAETIAALAMAKFARGEIAPSIAIEPVYLRNLVAIPSAKRS